MGDYVFDDELELDDASELVEQGHRLLCPECGEVLNVNTILDDGDQVSVITGIECPRGSTHVQIRILTRRAREFTRNLIQERKDAQTCQVIIVLVGKLPLPLNEYNVYVDGNIECDLNLAKRQRQPPEIGGTLRLTLGEHRIVVRESNVKKKHRLESNTIWFTSTVGDLPLFEVSLNDGQLRLVMHSAHTP